MAGEGGRTLWLASFIKATARPKTRWGKNEWSPREAVRHGLAKRGQQARGLGRPEAIDQTKEKMGNASDLQILQKTFDRMK